MSTDPIVPFAAPELPSRWARHALRACSILQRLCGADRSLPPVEALARAARALLNGAVMDPETCEALTTAALAFAHRELDSLIRDPRDTRRDLLAPYAEASVTAVRDWVRCARGDGSDWLAPTPVLPEENPTMPAGIQQHVHGVTDPGPGESDRGFPDTAHALDPLREELHLALIQADVGEMFPQLVHLADALVAAAVLAALNEPPDMPF